MLYQISGLRLGALLALSLGLVGAQGSASIFREVALAAASGFGVQIFMYPLAYLAASRAGRFRLGWGLLISGLLISSFGAGLLVAVVSPMVNANIKLFPYYAIALFAIPAAVVTILHLALKLLGRSEQSPDTGAPPGP